MGYQNFFATKLFTDIGSSDVTITLETAPTETSGNLVLEARNPTQREIISYTGVSGVDITGVTRGLGGTTAKSHLKNSLVEMNLVAQDISDLYTAFDTFTESAGDGWLPSLSSFSVSSGYNKGNRSFAVDTGDDLTNVLSPGMRMKFTRGTAAPTQSADLEAASTQYASRASASVSGITFTDDFTCEAWVKLESYTTTSAESTIIARFSGTGWLMRVDSTGRLTVYGASGSARSYATVQSIPLGKWVHVAATLDMSAGAADTYIDGVSVPNTSISATGTSLVQAGDLMIGNYNGATDRFDGKIADVRVWSTKRTAIQIQDNMCQLLTGTETSLVAYYPLNGDFNDLTANGNHLTPSGGASATATDNPYKTTEHAIITAISYAGATTTLTLQTSLDGVIPNMALSSPFYSTQAAPFGFPKSAYKWRIEYIKQLAGSQGSLTSGTWYNLNSYQMTVPVGSWVVGQKGTVWSNQSAGTSANGYRTLSTANNTESDNQLTIYTTTQQTSGNIVSQASGKVSVPLELDTPTTFYVNFKTTMSLGSGSIRDIANTDYSIIFAECAYL